LLHLSPVALFFGSAYGSANAGVFAIVQTLFAFIERWLKAGYDVVI
jgi:hypothetical protein